MPAKSAPTRSASAPDRSGLALLALRAEALPAALFDGPFPSRLVICPPGNHATRSRGSVIVDSATFDGLSARQAAIGLGMRLALDAEHCTVEGHPAYLASEEPRPVLAWCTLTGSPEDGLVFDAIEPTPLGLEAWKNRQFQDLSPTVFRDAAGRVLAVHSAAFCRHGELDGLTIEAAATRSAALTAAFTALSAFSTPTTPTDTPPPVKPAQIAALSAIAVALGLPPLPETPDDAAIESHLTAIGAEIDKLKKHAAPDAMSLQLTTLSARITEIENERDGLKRDALIAQAGAAGKVIPLSAEVLKITPLSVLTDLIAALPAGQVKTEHGTQKTQKDGEKPTALSADLKAMLAKCGLSEEDHAKYGSETPGKTDDA
jgi:phage I-like protein